MKITDRIPGDRITGEEGDNIAQSMLSALNPKNLHPLKLWDELTQLTREEAINSIRNALCDEYYLLYTYYLNKPSHRVFSADKQSVIDFLTDNFDEENGEGIDIIISDNVYENIILGNHDGVLAARL